jgi:hypothetical protein
MDNTPPRIKYYFLFFLTIQGGRGFNFPPLGAIINIPFDTPSLVVASDDPATRGSGAVHRQRESSDESRKSSIPTFK